MIVVVGGSGIGLIDRSVKTGKWLDEEQWVEESDAAREESFCFYNQAVIAWKQYENWLIGV